MRVQDAGAQSTRMRTTLTPTRRAASAARSVTFAPACRSPRPAQQPKEIKEAARTATVQAKCAGIVARLGIFVAQCQKKKVHAVGEHTLASRDGQDATVGAIGSYFDFGVVEQLDWRSALEVVGTCLEYLDLLFTEGFGLEVGNRLIAAIHTIFPLDMPRTVKALRGWSRLTPLGGGRFGDSVAATETCGRSCDRSKLPGLLTPWGVGEPGRANKRESRRFRAQRPQAEGFTASYLSG